MKTPAIATRLILAATVAGAAELAARSAAASSLLQSPPLTCTSVNCKSMKIQSRVFADVGSEVNPFVVQVFAQNPGQCLRLDLVSAEGGADLQMLLASPVGTAWRSDDRAPGDERPLLQVITDRGGFHALQISSFTGAPPSSASFVLKYGNYVTAEGIAANCPNPTPALVDAP